MIGHHGIGSNKDSASRVSRPEGSEEPTKLLCLDPADVPSGDREGISPKYAERAIDQRQNMGYLGLGRGSSAGNDSRQAIMPNSITQTFLTGP